MRVEGKTHVPLKNTKKPKSPKSPAKKAKQKSVQLKLLYVPMPDANTAQELIQKALAAKLIACANQWPIQSTYYWRGKLCQDQELAVLFKTSAGKIAALEKWLQTEHPYETPCFLRLSPEACNPAYLNWAIDCLQEAAK